MSVASKAIDLLAIYRAQQLEDFATVSDHELVMHPDDYATLMDDRRTHQFVDCLTAERNFGGAPVVLDLTAKEMKVRGRTHKQGAPHVR